MFWEKRVGTEGTGIAPGEDGGSHSPPWEVTDLGPDPIARVPGRRSLLQVEEEGRGQAQACGC